jgi:asparagine synthase (glutamine-hydrolysing)
MRRLNAAVTFKLDYWHKEGLPDALMPLDGMLGSFAALGLLDLHKFLAYRKWLRHELAPYAAAVVADSRTRQLPYWDARQLPQLVQDHAAGRRNRLSDIHAVLTLEAVHRMLIDDSAYIERAAASV